MAGRLPPAKRVSYFVTTIGLGQTLPITQVSWPPTVTPGESPLQLAGASLAKMQVYQQSEYTLPRSEAVKVQFHVFRQAAGAACSGVRVSCSLAWLGPSSGTNPTTPLPRS